MGGAILALILSAAGAQDADWPCFRGPNRDGISAETGLDFDWPAEGPKALWKRNVGTGYSSIAVARGRAFALGNREARDTLCCLDAATGAEVWTHACDCPLLPRNYAGGPGATPLADGDLVFIVSKKGLVSCLDAASGRAVWDRDIAKDPGAKTPDWGFEGSPVVLGDRLYLNAGAAGLCLDKATGKTVWASDPAGQAGYSTPVFRRAGGRTVMAVMGEKAVRGVDAADGKVLWEHDWPTSFGENITDPFWIGERLFVSTSHGMGAVLLDVSGAGPKPVWTSPRHGTHTNTSVLWKDHLYGFDGLMQNPRGRGLNCVDPKTGEILWRKDDHFGTLLVADGKLVMLLVDGQLVAAEASPAGYREAARARVLQGRCWTMPTLAKGRLYVRNDAGDLACLEMRK